MKLEINSNEKVCANCKHCKVHYIELDDLANFRGEYLTTTNGKHLVPIFDCHCINTEVRKRKIKLTDTACYAFEGKNDNK